MRCLLLARLCWVGVREEVGGGGEREVVKPALRILPCAFCVLHVLQPQPRPLKPGNARTEVAQVAVHTGLRFAAAVHPRQGARGRFSEKCHRANICT